MGTATLEEQLLQQLITMRGAFFHYIFLDLCKSYNTLDMERCLDILVGYGVRPRMLRILSRSWVWLQIASKSRDHCRPVLHSHCGVTQGDPLSPTIFNVFVDAVIRHWMTVVEVPQEGAIQGLGTSTQTVLALFYGNDGLILLPERACHQGAFDALRRIFG